ncbi:MAG: DUF456 domain-containing protein [Actinomycetota bacterium]
MNEGLVAVVAAVMVVGLFGTIAPLVPGLPVIWTAGLVYGVLAGFGSTGAVALSAMTLLMLAGAGAKLVLPHRRASAGGAPRSTLWIGLLGGVIGFFVLPVLGLPLGAVAGVLLAEYRRTGDWSLARASTKHVIVGFGIGALVEIGAGVAMIACWAAWVVLST